MSLGALGCTSTESRCETLCEWADKCATGETVSCTDAEIDECVDEYDDEKSACQDAFDELADCIDDEEQVCSDVQEHCVGEATEFLEQCATEG